MGEPLKSLNRHVLRAIRARAWVLKEGYYDRIVARITRDVSSGLVKPEQIDGWCEDGQVHGPARAPD